MTRAPDPRADEEFLDRCFARIVDGIGEGEPQRLEDLVAGREHLRAELAELLETAEQVVVSRPRPRVELPGYRIEREIGRGSMGTVLLARQDRLGGRLVAVKVLPPAGALSPRARSRFRAESRLLAALEHPNIVSVFDIVEGGDVDAFVMEWVEGESLASLLQHLRAGGGHDLEAAAARLGAGSAEELAEDWVQFVVGLGIRLARALDTVHAAGVLHRDVKPSNVLLRRDGTPLLSDFGLARRPDASVSTRTGGFLGTMAYAAPEQLAGQELDARADVYALGASLAEALVPESAASPGRGAAALSASLGRRRCGVPRDLAVVLGKALEHDRERRFAGAAELADDLERFARREPVRARPPSLGRRARLGAARHRSALGVGALTALILGSLLGWTLWRQHQREHRPERVRAHVERAQLHLLSEDIARWIFEYAHAETTRIAADETRPPPEALRAAIEEYDRALDLFPNEPKLRAQRAVIALAESWWDTGAASAEELDALPEGLVLTRRLASSEDLGARIGELGDAEEAGASDPDLLSAGLLAYLRGEIAAALRLWTWRGFDPEVDALADGSLGILHLLRRDSAGALRWLERALEAAPNARGLLLSHARAAAYERYYQEAGEGLERYARGFDASRASRRERHAIAHVEALIEGGLHGAGAGLELFEEIVSRNRTPSILRDHADVAERAGDLEAALESRARLAEYHAEVPAFGSELVETAADWWAELGDGGQRRLLLNLLEGRGPERIPVANLRAQLRAALDRLERNPKSATVAPTPSSGSLRLATDVLRALQSQEMLMKFPLSLGRLDDTAKRSIARLWLGQGPPLGKLWLPAMYTLALSSADAQTLLYEITGSGPGGMAGFAMAALGDVDGDGYGDFAYGASGADSGVLVDVGSVTVVSGRCGTTLYEVLGSAAGEHFGASVAAIGDLDGDLVSELLVGAPVFGVAGPGATRVLSGATGLALAGHFQVGGKGGDHFGTAVAAAGDLNGDGVPDYLVGADQRTNGDRGYVRAYSGATGTLLFARSGASPGDAYGTSVVGLDDLDSDGRPELAVGASQPGSQNPGYVELLSFGGVVVSPLHVYSDPNAQFWTAFGLRLSRMDDVDGDGKGELLIGDNGFGVNNDSGRVYCFSTAAPGYAKLWHSDASGSGDGYGTAVTDLGLDLDGDGVHEVAAGAHEVFKGSQNGPGYVRILSGASGAIHETWPGAANGDRYGERLASLGDLDGDGAPELGIASKLATPAHAPLPGTIEVWSLLDLPLATDTHVLSMTAGGTQTFSIHEPAEPLGFYLLLGSLTGTSPGTVVGPGLILPLTLDPLTLLGLTGANSPPYTANFGVLDGSGKATASLSIPAGAFPTLPLPIKAFHACLFLKVGSGAVTGVSGAVPLTLFP